MKSLQTATDKKNVVPVAMLLGTGKVQTACCVSLRVPSWFSEQVCMSVVCSLTQFARPSAKAALDAEPVLRELVKSLTH